ncbi:unnamed protein product [Anisakis simplex]|uniref:Glutamate carboxypeptidase 2 homolog (inferred by orthology to a C. elegans protein) n=1 Tax=Anisakis simplex TaxID=6269 RepID=A0A0M3K480_ANISI|nr:unnamed protein product [Anisakis simplex]
MMRATSVLGIGFVAIVLVGLLGVYHTAHPAKQPRLGTVEDYHQSISERLISNVKGENIRENLRLLTSLPHPAGTRANTKVASKIADLWRKNGLSDVHFTKYEVLLSYPNYETPNRMLIIADSGRLEYISKGVSPVIIPEEQGAEGAGIQWLAYSENGTAEGEIVYCNYGTTEDFEWLNKLGISVKDRIALMRYGKGFRGDKVRKAQLNGAIGAILYSDPAEVKDDGSLPSIPVLPLSYSDAYEILRRMKGRAAPMDWQGGLNITYRTGPYLKNDATVRIVVHSSLQTRTIRNVIGYIHGADDPDRYVILGNHFDAWVYGSIDPNSGTAVLAEVARAISQTINETNWRPARTIMFCSWDAEEYGLIGSTEFVEEYANILSRRAVVYLNVDNIHSNQSMHASTVPTLYQMTTNVAKRIPNPMISEVHRAVGQYWAELAREFTDSAVIPLNISDLANSLVRIYAPDLKRALDPLRYYAEAISDAKEQLRRFIENCQEFLRRAQQFELIRRHALKTFEAYPFDARRISLINDRMMSVDRCFINPHHFPNAPMQRHVLYSINVGDSYKGEVMAAVYSEIDAFTKATTQEEREKIGRKIAEQISVVQYSVQCASNTIMEII